jgi:hypothetical protein
MLLCFVYDLILLYELVKRYQHLADKQKLHR